MFADSYSLNYAGTGDLVLTKRREDSFASEYQGTVGVRDFVMVIKHTVPKQRTSGEASHVVRLDCIEYDATNTVVAKSSTWRVLGTYQGRQDATHMSNMDKAVASFLTAGNLTKLLNNES
ncbi:coat protein [ssRNA phage SRR6960799_39]|uniref:Coat protein n=1 Tax=ssRNA phage SRR6960799_39 TaxID=2786597 RepID=A0A8S5KZR2_9VIRU|nr:coat protein [ssRNA phage SRR6960799_39]DAD50691.1 TPA_asm: coat protein [ssRNA phage SRR6960799_39]